MLNCAACGEGGDGLKTCNACKLVKYCNATCQKAHRPMHKKECKQRAAELKDEALFKQPPPREECGVCLLTLPLSEREISYQMCCGKTICIGCIYGVAQTDGNRILCPFCRTPGVTSDGEAIERRNKRIEYNDAVAMNQLASYYDRGIAGFPRDYEKAMELWLRAGELGYAMAYYNIADSYRGGGGVERDMDKAKHYFELAAMGGHAVARHNIGCIEGGAGKMDRALKHYMIAAGAGCDDSLPIIRQLFMNGHATKNDFEKALRAHKEAKDDMMSDQREAALADQRFMRQAVGY